MFSVLNVYKSKMIPEQKIEIRNYRKSFQSPGNRVAPPLMKSKRKTEMERKSEKKREGRKENHWR